MLVIAIKILGIDDLSLVCPNYHHVFAFLVITNMAWPFLTYNFTNFDKCSPLLKYSMRYIYIIIATSTYIIHTASYCDEYSCAQLLLKFYTLDCILSSFSVIFFFQPLLYFTVLLIHAFKLQTKGQCLRKMHCSYDYPIANTRSNTFCSTLAK